MTKAEFLDELCRRIKMLPPNEAERAVSYYSEVIDDKIESGMSEEDAVLSLGNLDDIVLQVEGAALKNTPQPKRAEKKYTKTILTAVLVVIIAAAVAFSAGELVSHFMSGMTELPEIPQIPTDGVFAIAVETVSGDITIAESPDEYIHIEFENGYEIKRGGTLIVRPRTGFSTGSKPVTVMLPAGFTPALGLTTVSGKAAISADCTEFTAETVSGDVEFNGVSAGNISIETVSGLVTGTLNASRSDYLIRVSTVSGKYTYQPEAVKDLPEYTLDFESISGDLEVQFAE